MDTVTAVIVDIVGSRRAVDRAAVQADVHTAFETADQYILPLSPLWSTAGDEFQAVYASVEAACAATTLVRVHAGVVDVRFGLGVGTSSVVSGQADEVPIYDGSAWWNAREAIDEVHRLAGRSGSARTWLTGERPDTANVNAALLLRDHVIDLMKPRERRIAAALLAGRLQSEIAETEGITQSAVSQSARRSGAATLVRVQELWTGRMR